MCKNKNHLPNPKIYHHHNFHLQAGVGHKMSLALTDVRPLQLSEDKATEPFGVCPVY